MTNAGPPGDGSYQRWAIASIACSFGAVALLFVLGRLSNLDVGLQLLICAALGVVALVAGARSAALSAREGRQVIATVAMVLSVLALVFILFAYLGAGISEEL
jgi:hypothetical protein